jgi:anti-sigma B factor antagonist
MTTGTTSVDVRTLTPTASAIVIRGDVTSASEGPLMDAYASASAAGAQTIVLDFRGLDYMNSGGIGLLVTLLVRVQRQGQRLTPWPQRPLPGDPSLTRLDEAIAIYPSEADVLASVSRLNTHEGTGSRDGQDDRG